MRSRSQAKRFCSKCHNEPGNCICGFPYRTADVAPLDVDGVTMLSASTFALLVTASVSFMSMQLFAMILAVAVSQ